MNLTRPFRWVNSSIFVSFLVLLFSSAPRLAGAPVQTPKAARIVFDSFQPVLSDFDNDNTIDRAILRHSGGRKTIHVVSGGPAWTTLSFDSNTLDRGALVSGDIDHDGDQDLVWISHSADRFVAWLGDGHGNFRASTDGSIALDQVWALQWRSNRASFDRGNAVDSTALPTFTDWISRSVGRGESLLTSDNVCSCSNVSALRNFAVRVLKLRGPPSPISTN